MGFQGGRDPLRVPGALSERDRGYLSAKVNPKSCTQYTVALNTKH